MPHATLATTSSRRAPRASWSAHRGHATDFPWDVPALLLRCEAERLPFGAAILRGALTERQQRWLYQSLYELAEPGSSEIDGLRATATAADLAALNPDNRPQPFVTWVHPYTRESNARHRPARLLQWAQRLMHALVPASRSHCVDSMLAQLYAGGGSLLKHCDADLSWGIGVSLGSAAHFDCFSPGGAAAEAPRRVVVRSGDVLVGEFGLMPHAVSVPTAAAPPAWWGGVDAFGKRRCNVLFRQAQSAREQLELAEQRARAVYGMSLAELREQTGHGDAFLAVHLRHAAVE